MKEDHDNFNMNFEKLAAKKFLAFYNSSFGTSFRITTDAPREPDFHCRDRVTGEELKFDITIATVAPRDPKIFRQLLAGTYEGMGVPVGVSFEEELAAYKENIEKKFTKRYGSGCALVVYHMGLPWDWDEPARGESPTNKLSRLRTEIDYTASPFDKGIWFLSWERVYRLDQGNS